MGALTQGGMAFGAGIGSGMQNYRDRREKRNLLEGKAGGIKRQLMALQQEDKLNEQDAKLLKSLDNLDELGAKKIQSLVADYETGQELKENRLKMSLLESQEGAAAMKFKSMQGLMASGKERAGIESGFVDDSTYGVPEYLLRDEYRIPEEERAAGAFPGDYWGDEISPIYEDVPVRRGGGPAPWRMDRDGLRDQQGQFGPANLGPYMGEEGAATPNLGPYMGEEEGAERFNWEGGTDLPAPSSREPRGLDAREARDAYIKSKSDALNSDPSSEEAARMREKFGSDWDKQNPRGAGDVEMAGEEWRRIGSHEFLHPSVEYDPKIHEINIEQRELDRKIEKYRSELEGLNLGEWASEDDLRDIAVNTLPGMYKGTKWERGAKWQDEEMSLEEAAVQENSMQSIRHKAERSGISEDKFHKAVNLQAWLDKAGSRSGEFENAREQHRSNTRLNEEMEANPDMYGGQAQVENLRQQMGIQAPGSEAREVLEPGASGMPQDQEIVGYDRQFRGYETKPFEEEGLDTRVIPRKREGDSSEERRTQLIDALAKYDLTPEDRKKAIDMISEKYPQLKKMATEYVTAGGETIGYDVGGTFVKSPKGGKDKPQGWRLKSVTEDSDGKKSYIYENPRNLPTYVPTASKYAQGDSELTLTNENAPSEGQAKEFNTAAGNAKKIQEDAKRLIELTKDKNWFQQRITDRAFMAEVSTTIATMRGMLRPILIGPGAMSDIEQKMLSNALPDPSDFFRLDAATLQRFATLGDLVGKKMKYHGESIGLWEYNKQDAAAQSSAAATNAADPLNIGL